jgi:hypothetical protein
MNRAPIQVLAMLAATPCAKVLGVRLKFAAIHLQYLRMSERFSSGISGKNIRFPLLA